MCVYVCVCEGERESVCVCDCVCVSVYVYVLSRFPQTHTVVPGVVLRENTCLYEQVLTASERPAECVCVCVCVCKIYKER